VQHLVTNIGILLLTIYRC